MCKLHWILLFLFLTQLGTGCARISTDTATVTPTTFQKQPEPQSPIIKGQFSGLSGDVLITTHIQTLSGREVQWGTRRGNGAWESVISNQPDMDYTVTAEAEGYTSTPISYTIHVTGESVFLRVDGKVTANEAFHLDFHFVPVATTTPEE